MTENLSWLCSDVAAADDEDAADPEEKESSCDLITRFGSDRSKNHIFCGSHDPKWIINHHPILDEPIPWR